MKVVNRCTLKEMQKQQKEEAKRHYEACDPEQCPKCRCSDG